MNLKVSPAKCWTFCIGLNVLLLLHIRAHGLGAEQNFKLNVQMCIHVRLVFSVIRGST